MLEILDGGMIFELNKLYSDLGQTALTKNPEIIASIYQKYIDMGCHYITSCNYGFKSLKLDNWAELVEKAVDLCFRLKNKNYSKNTKLLGSLPPYYESYYHGPVIPEFTNFYNKLVDIMDSKVDEYILETQVDIKHIDEILSILTKKSKKKVKISIYPSSNITGINIATILEKYNNIDAIMVNCCSFAEVISYYLYHIVNLKLEEQDIKFGFYCNKIDEKKYKNYQGDKKTFQLQDYIVDENIPVEELYKFIKYLEHKNQDIIIGGCCGYGIEEMKSLMSILNCYQVLQTARL